MVSQGQESGEVLVTPVVVLVQRNDAEDLVRGVPVEAAVGQAVDAADEESSPGEQRECQGEPDDHQTLP